MLRSFCTKLLVVVFCVSCAYGKDHILEFKGAYFLPVSSTFRDVYGGGGLFGTELSMQLCNDKPWYIFASIDYFKKKGRRLNSAEKTQLRLLPLALGVKYFVPVSKRTDFYLGLGFQSAHIKKTTEQVCVKTKDTQWSLGALGKTGFYVDLKRNFVLDFFFNYSFLRTNKNDFYGPTHFLSKVNIHGAYFGTGLGYRF